MKPSELARVLRQLNVAGIEFAAGDGDSAVVLAATSDEFEVRIALPRWYGSFRLSGREMRRAQAASVLDLLIDKSLKCRDQLRGDVVVEMLNDEWTLPRIVDEATLQKLERAALRLMEAVDEARKGFEG